MLDQIREYRAGRAARGSSMRRVDIDKPARQLAVLWEVATVLAGLMLAGCASVQATGDPSVPVPGQPVPASAIDRLTAMAIGFARVNGGGTAEWASAVVTTREKALTSATPGDFIPGSAETIVYLVTMKGHFISRRAAPRAKNPTGNYLSFVVNAEDFGPLDFGIHHNPPPVAPASFGPLTYLKVGAGRQIPGERSQGQA